MTDSLPVVREDRGGLVILRLNQPGTMNALTVEIKQSLGAEVSDFIRDPAARCLLITGADKVFCAGGDVRNMVGEQPALEVRERLALSHENWVRHLLMGGKPVIMAVNGPAVGAGFALAMLGDIIIASESAYFMAGFSAMGAAADMGLGATLPRAVGMIRAKDILFSNRRISAQEALSMGMVTSLAAPDDLMATALKMGDNLANAATVGIGLTKMLLNMGYEQSLSSLFATEAIAQTVAFSTADRAEGAAAFLERRKPKFIGG